MKPCTTRRQAKAKRKISHPEKVWKNPWAYLSLNGFWASVVLIASVVPITVVTNAGRVVVTGLIGQWFGIEYSQGFFHTFSGWLIFLSAFACLLMVHGLIRLVGSGQGKEVL